MLVLGREIGESILILHNGVQIAEIKLCGVRGRGARIAIEADREYVIVRSEIQATGGANSDVRNGNDCQRRV